MWQNKWRMMDSCDMLKYICPSVEMSSLGRGLVLTFQLQDIYILACHTCHHASFVYCSSLINVCPTLVVICSTGKKQRNLQNKQRTGEWWFHNRDVQKTSNVKITAKAINPLKPSVTMWLHFECSAPYRPNLLFLIFDIPALWRSGLSARVPECQKLKTAG